MASPVHVRHVDPVTVEGDSDMRVSVADFRRVVEELLP